MNKFEEIRRETYDNTWLSKDRDNVFNDKNINRKEFSWGKKSFCMTIDFTYSRKSLGLGGPVLALR